MGASCRRQSAQELTAPTGEDGVAFLTRMPTPRELCALHVKPNHPSFPSLGSPSPKFTRFSARLIYDLLGWPEFYFKGLSTSAHES